jgi:hypothetical protein
VLWTRAAAGYDELASDLPSVRLTYQIYGVGIQSDISISGVEPRPDSDPDVTLRFESGSAPTWVTNGLQLAARVVVDRFSEKQSADPAFRLIEHGNGECHELRYEGETTFVVNRATDRVWGSVHPPFTNADLATYFLGPVMGFILRQRRVTCLHASAVELQGQGVVFAGDAGHGKSTTAGALALRGVPVMTDDIVPLELTKDEIWVRSGYPRVCLWPEAVENLLGTAEALPKLTPVWEKHFLPLDGVRGKFVGEKRPLGLIYVFAERSQETNAPRIEEMQPREALLELVKTTYMNWLLDRDRRAEEFDDLCKVVERVPVRRIIPHQDPMKIGALCELILADAARHSSRVAV